MNQKVLEREETIRISELKDGNKNVSGESEERTKVFKK